MGSDSSNPKRHWVGEVALVAPCCINCVPHIPVQEPEGLFRREMCTLVERIIKCDIYEIFCSFSRFGDSFLIFTVFIEFKVIPRLFNSSILHFRA